MWTKAPKPKAELPPTSDFPHLASLPVRGTGETIAAVCLEFGIASYTRQRQTVRPRRSNREIYCCPHVDHRSSADSLFIGVHVTTPSSQERDEHRRKTICGSDSDRTAHRDAGRGTETGSVRPAGEWLAPYSSAIVTDPGRLDVDHMVPLGNAHDSGSWQWSAEQRERYANYLEDPQHLIAVTASANRSKGARGPDQWKPEDRTYWCQYATDWITIKSTWELTVTQQEHTALVQMLNTCAKRPELMVSSQSQVKPTPGPTSNPVQQTPTPEMRTYNSCDAAQAPVCRAAKAAVMAFPSRSCPAPETATATASYANDRTDAL